MNQEIIKIEETKVMDNADRYKSIICQSGAKLTVDCLSGMFEYDGVKINYVRLDVKDKFDKIWINANEICNFIGYKEARSAVSSNVDPEFVRRYENIKKLIIQVGATNPDLRSHKLQAKSLFINRPGVVQLLTSSSMNTPIVKDFKNLFLKDVIIDLLDYGACSIKPIEDIEYKSFYNENSISQFSNVNVLYCAYIGVHNNEHLFKFGISGDFPRRELLEHRKTFDIFDCVYIRECDNKDVCENYLKRDLAAKNILRSLDCKGKKQTELFCVTNVFTMDKILALISEIIERNPLPSLKKKEDELKQVKEDKNYELEKLKIELEMRRELTKIEELKFKSNKPIIKEEDNEYCGQVASQDALLDIIKRKEERQKAVGDIPKKIQLRPKKDMLIDSELNNECISRFDMEIEYLMNGLEELKEKESKEPSIKIHKLTHAKIRGKKALGIDLRLEMA
jgi:hypothetical protein